jgi:predicted alpha/beta-hydrolase family hydrolase
LFKFDVQGGGRIPQTLRNPRLVFHIESGPENAGCRLILAHGAGAGITSPFLEKISELLAERKIAVTRFEFDYMSARRHGKARRPPPKAQSLADEYRDFLRGRLSQARYRPPLVIGGKSLGGRVASLVADEFHQRKDVSGLVCFGYPFHPPRKPERLRIEHLEKLRCPTLIVQGERDPFGNRAEIEALNLSEVITFAWIGDGDHDFGPRSGSGFTREGNLAAAADAIAAFIAGLERPR